MEEEVKTWWLELADWYEEQADNGGCFFLRKQPMHSCIALMWITPFSGASGRLWRLFKPMGYTGERQHPIGSCLNKGYTKKQVSFMYHMADYIRENVDAL